MRVSLVGVSCVGTTTAGRLLAGRRGWPFFDLDEEIERHFGASIERLQARFLTGYSYRKECAVVLERIATANPDCVIALPPSGLRDAFLRVIRRVPCVTVAVHDTPENILERITFYDIDSRPIDKHLTDEERALQLKEIKADISYFKRSYERADLHVTIAGLGPEASAAAIDARLAVASAVRMRQACRRGSPRYGSAHVAPIPPLPPPEGEERLPALVVADGVSLEERIDEIMDRVEQAGDDHAERAAALEEYLALARAHEDETWFDVAAWSEDLADSYLALGRVDDAVRTIGDATRRGYAEGAEMLCELAEKLMRSGHEPQARPLWQQARADYSDDVWVYVQAGIEYGDLGDHAEALEWLTTGLELALRTGDPEGALEQLRPLRASCLAALGRSADEIQQHAAQGEHT